MAIPMAFLRRHRVLVVLLGLGVLVSVLVGYRIEIVQPMQDIVVRKSGPNGVPIHVKDIGSVEDSAEKQTAIVRVNGNRAVFLRINKQPGANTVAVVDQVKELLPRLMGVPPGVDTLYVMFEERFPRTIAPIEDDGAPPRREAPAQ
jgi:multidrug efflux pump subunit AcrB